MILTKVSIFSKIEPIIFVIIIGSILEKMLTFGHI